MSTLCILSVHFVVYSFYLNEWRIFTSIVYNVDAFFTSGDDMKSELQKL